MQEKLDELWSKLGEKVNERVCSYLRTHHSKYKRILEQVLKMEEENPMLGILLDGEGDMTVDRESHKMLKEYLHQRDALEQIEFEYSFFSGQCELLSYKEMLNCLKEEMK